MIQFREYEEFAEECFKKERHGTFVRLGRMLKKHPPANWRPIEWCDKCRADITGGLSLNRATKEALCARCAGSGDRAAFATVGILWDD